MPKSLFNIIYLFLILTKLTAKNVDRNGNRRQSLHKKLVEDGETLIDDILNAYNEYNELEPKYPSTIPDSSSSRNRNMNKLNHRESIHEEDVTEDLEEKSLSNFEAEELVDAYVEERGPVGDDGYIDDSNEADDYIEEANDLPSQEFVNCDQQLEVETDATDSNVHPKKINLMLQDYYSQRSLQQVIIENRHFLKYII